MYLNQIFSKREAKKKTITDSFTATYSKSMKRYQKQTPPQAKAKNRLHYRPLHCHL